MFRELIAHMNDAMGFKKVRNERDMEIPKWL